MEPRFLRMVGRDVEIVACRFRQLVMLRRRPLIFLPIGLDDGGGTRVLKRVDDVDPGAAVGVKTWPVGRIDAVPKFPTGCVVWPLPNCAEARLGAMTKNIAVKRSRLFAKVHLQSL